jgi:hypothetical protein
MHWFFVNEPHHKRARGRATAVPNANPEYYRRGSPRENGGKMQKFPLESSHKILCFGAMKTK